MIYFVQSMLKEAAVCFCRTGWCCGKIVALSPPLAHCPVLVCVARPSFLSLSLFVSLLNFLYLFVAPALSLSLCHLFLFLDCECVVILIADFFSSLCSFLSFSLSLSLSRIFVSLTLSIYCLPLSLHVYDVLLIKYYA
jgi:hypothetical protein